MYVISTNYRDDSGILAIFVAQLFVGEGQGWTVVCGSWKIGSQLDKFLQEWERKREVTGSVENGRKWFSFSLIFWTFTQIFSIV